VLGACNSDVLEDKEKPPVPPGCAGIPPESDSAGGPGGEDKFESGLIHECSGTRKARIDVRVCTAPLCTSSQPVHDYIPPFESQPIVPEDLLEVEQVFGPSDGNPPPTAACCTEGTHEENIRATGLLDCAARSCLEVHDQIVVLKNALQVQYDSLDGGVKKSALGRALESLVFYAQQLEMPSAFKDCTNQLDGAGQYTLTNPEVTGIGALQDFVISGFECLKLDCAAKVPEDPTTGGGGGEICTENPNWFEGNAGEVAFGTGVPKSGSVTIELGGGKSQPAFHGLSIAYERPVKCAEPVCPFALTNLRFTLGDVSVGPLTMPAPSVSLDRVAFGARIGDEVTLGSGALVLRAEGAISVAGQPFLEDAVIPLYVANSGQAKLHLEERSLSLEDSHFRLIFGASAHLSIAATECDEW
jgi:hypothetical protein